MTALLQVKNLYKHFKVARGLVKSVDGVSFDVAKGETLGLVGESGCGKTTTGRTIVRLYDATEGQIIYKGTDLAQLTQRQMLPYRKEIQMIFQDPYASLNPRMTVGDIVMEPLIIHKFPKDEWHDRVRHLLTTVGLNSEHANRYPHEFSGGQRQRIGIARALAVDPEFIVCDEPISALDVSIQAQVINILEELQERFGFTYLFISHDLSMVRHISHQVGVMYLGNLIEYAQVDELFDHMLHPYTRSLISAVPVADPIQAREGSRIVLQGDVPSPLDPPAGCPFKARCSFAREICGQEKPVLKNVGGGHMVACHLYDTSVKRS